MSKFVMDYVIDLTDLEVEVEGVTGEFPAVTGVFVTINGEQRDILWLLGKKQREELLTSLIYAEREADQAAADDYRFETWRNAA